MEQQRRGNIVGQVADDAQILAQDREVEAERVDIVKRETLGWEFVDQARREIAVDLDDGKPAYPFEQGTRERAEAGPDLDYVVVALRVDSGDDAVDVMAINQEILAKPLPCDVPARGN